MFFVRTEMNLIAFLVPSNCVNTQYAALSGAMAYTKTHIYVEKNNSITLSISKFISLIYFSIKITIKE